VHDVSRGTGCCTCNCTSCYVISTSDGWVISQRARGSRCPGLHAMQHDVNQQWMDESGLCTAITVCLGWLG